jgi:hypothetical protein
MPWITPYRRLIRSEADELMRLHGGGAYSVARQCMRLARAYGDRRTEQYFSKVAMEIAKRAGHEIGLDTATRYVS